MGKLGRGKYINKHSHVVAQAIDTKRTFGPWLEKLRAARKKGDYKLMGKIIKEVARVNDCMRIEEALEQSGFASKEVNAILDYLRPSYQEPPKQGMELSGFTLTISKEPEERRQIDGPRIQIESDNT